MPAANVRAAVGAGRCDGYDGLTGTSVPTGTPIRRQADRVREVGRSYAAASASAPPAEGSPVVQHPVQDHDVLDNMANFGVVRRA